LSDPDVEAQLHTDSLTVGVIKTWRRVHLPIALVFAVLALAHITTILVLWSWK
jgi:hypothetical protein